MVGTDPHELATEQPAAAVIHCGMQSLFAYMWRCTLCVAHAMMLGAVSASFEAAAMDTVTQPDRIDERMRRVPLVQLSSVDRRFSQDLAKSQVDLLLRLQKEDGRIPYMIDSSGQEVPNRNNAIRQWLATLALAEYGRARASPSAIDAAVRHRDYLLDQMLVTFEGKPVLKLRNRIKLGTLAIAGMALFVIEQEDRGTDRLTSDQLLNTVLEMQNEDGGFRTFLHPPSRSDQQVFYPGEALTFMATLLPALEGDARAALLERCLTGIKHYRMRWYSSELMNPAFAPWHLQAISLVRGYASPATIDFLDGYASDLADFLVRFQQLDDARTDYELGRFYEPMIRRYGPPHTSSNGVYVEGLGAYAISEDVPDRRHLLQTVIRAAIRYVAQAQQHASILASLPDSAIPNSLNDLTWRIDNSAHLIRGYLSIQYVMNPETD